MISSIARKFRWALALPVIHRFATRVLGGRIRAASFDEKFQKGDWNFVAEKSSEMVPLLERYGGGLDFLILGCGAASIVGVVDPASYRTILGIDLSPVAISKAREYGSQRINFMVGDMEKIEVAGPFGVILFSESLYYLSCKRAVARLRQLVSNLDPEGVFIVTVSQPARYSKLLDAIRKNFLVVEDRSFKSSQRHLVVFRGD